MSDIDGGSGFLKMRLNQLVAEALKSGDSDGTSGGMEARLAKVEAALDHIGREMSDVKTDVRSLRDNARTDFRLVFAAIIAATLGLAGLMAKGFHWF
jgi:hypothetical protein